MATITGLRPKPDRGVPWILADGRPSEAFATFMQTAEVLLKMFNGTGGILLSDAVNDAAAAAAGVAVGALYRNGSVLMIRVV